MFAEDPMFDRYSNRARLVLDRSIQAARWYDHDYIDTEHLLLGLLRIDNGSAHDALRELHVNHDHVRVEVELSMAQGRTLVTSQQLPVTPRAKRAFELSVEEANRLGHNQVRTGHLLLGLIGEEHGFAARALRNCGVELAAARDQLSWILCRSEPEPPTKPPVPILTRESLVDKLVIVRERIRQLEDRVRRLEGK